MHLVDALADLSLSADLGMAKVVVESEQISA
jgi:hypothetical protein